MDRSSAYEQKDRKITSKTEREKRIYKVSHLGVVSIHRMCASVEPVVEVLLIC